MSGDRRSVSEILFEVLERPITALVRKSPLRSADRQDVNGAEARGDLPDPQEKQRPKIPHQLETSHAIKYGLYNLIQSTGCPSSIALTTNNSPGPEGLHEKKIHQRQH